MKRIVKLFVILLLLSSIIACAKKAEAPTVSKEDKPVRLGLITQPLNNIFYVVLKDAAIEYAATLKGVQITVLDGKNIEDQVKVFEDFAATKPDAIGVAAIDKTAIIPAIENAKAQGIPTFCVDNESRDSARVSYIGTDNLKGAEELAKYIIKRLNGEGRIAIVEGPGGNHNSNIRLQGINNIFTTEKHNIKIVASVTANWRRDEAMNVTNDILTANPKLDMVVCLNDEMASGAMEAIAATKRKEVILLGYNGVPEAIMNTYEGGFQGTVVQFPELMAKNFIDSAVALVRNGVQPPDLIPIVASVVDTEFVKSVVDDKRAPKDDTEKLLFAKLIRFHKGTK